MSNESSVSSISMINSKVLTKLLETVPLKLSLSFIQHLYLLFELKCTFAARLDQNDGSHSEMKILITIAASNCSLLDIRLE